MAQVQPERSDEHLPGSGSRPQLSLASAPVEAAEGAVWFTACAWCGRLEVGGRWVDALTALEGSGREPQLTHGICPTCFDEVSARADDERRRRGA